MLIAFKPGSNLLERLYQAEEPFGGTALLVEFRIEPAWPSSLRVRPGSWVDRDVALDPSFPIVLANLPRIVGRIGCYDRGVILNIRHCKCFECWSIEPGIMDIGG